MPKQTLALPQLESHLWESANILRGPVDAADFKTYIFPLLFFKRICDIWDDEYQEIVDDTGDEQLACFPESHRFQIPEDCHWNDVRGHATNVGTALQHAMRDIEKANPDALYGVFGDAQWSNKDRLSDALLKDLIEHFSRLPLGSHNVTSDMLGDAYEYLIKKFADATNKKAGEFYTPRSIVRVMIDMLDPKEGETIYDPACGTGGMLLAAVQHVKEMHGDVKRLWGKLFGQEKNLTTSSIARMNLFLHGVEDFQIIRGDTLAEPRHSDGDRLRQFDVILANPPYSIKQWDRVAFEKDKWGRNFLGTPPQGRADYAFQQHILASLTAKGRCAVLWPHGVLFRNEEQAMRTKMIEQDWVEVVIGLGPNLFYNSPMESCILVCNRRKPAARKGKVLFIDAISEVTRERAQSFLKPEHQRRILNAHRDFTDEAGFARVLDIATILANGANLSIPQYVKRTSGKSTGNADGQPTTLPAAWEQWQAASAPFWQQMDALVDTLDGLADQESPR